MKEQSFILKSYRKGLTLYIKPEAEMETLLLEVKEKFQTSRQFFGTMQVGLALSGKELTAQEEEALVDAITESSDLQIVCLIGKDEKVQHLFEESLKEEGDAPKEDMGTDGQFYRGTLKKGQSLETKHSVIILGDVNPGAKVFSGKDIIVLGALLGEAHAGISGEESGRFVCALEFSPERLKIGSRQYERGSGKPLMRLLPDPYKKLPKIATLQEGEIIVKPVTKEFLGQITVDSDND